MCGAELMIRRAVHSVVDMPLHRIDDHTHAHMFHPEHLGLIDPFIDPAAVFKVAGPEMPVWEQDGVRVKVAAGRFRDPASPINTDPRWATPVDLLDVRISAGATFHWPIEHAKNGFVLVLAGALACAEHAASAPQALVLSPAQRGDAGQGMVALETGAQGAHVVCFSGLPLREPVVPYGPFIGNSREDISTYAHAFQSGAMGELKASFIR